MRSGRVGTTGRRNQPRRDRAISNADAHHTFELLHTWLGTVIGETIGYALTATFTILVAFALTTGIAPRWMTFAGYATAALIATGVVIPLVSMQPASPTSSATSPGARGSSPWLSSSGAPQPAHPSPRRYPRAG